MRTNNSISVFLIIALSLVTLNNVVQAGSPQPPPPHGATAPDDGCLAIPIDGTFILKNMDALNGNRIESARTVTCTFFGQGEVLHSIECVDKAPLDISDKNFVETMKDFLVTDSSLYFLVNRDSQ